MEDFSYQIISETFTENQLTVLLNLYTTIFDSADIDFFKNRIKTKENVFAIVAYEKENPIGFKIGYRYNEETMYSWVGGVLESHRKFGAGQKLMELQHKTAKNQGYKKARTKSMNAFKPMMILNLKNGFNITNVYTNAVNQTKIIFEKRL